MADDTDATVPITVRLPTHLVTWLTEKQTQLKREDLDVSIPTLIRQQLERAKRSEETKPHAPKKARTSQ